jgi:hypothetical protein
VPDTRARVIALCRRGFAPVGVSSLVRPGETYPPHPVAQRELEQFLERSTHRFEPIDTILEALFVDALRVGVMRAALIYEDGTPEGLVRLDAEEAVRTFDGFEAPADDDQAGWKESIVDAWERAPVSGEALWRWRHLHFGTDPPDHVLFPVVRHLQGRCTVLLRPLLGPVLAAQGIRHALASCRFADPNEPGPVVRTTTADTSDPEPETTNPTVPGSASTAEPGPSSGAASVRPGGGRPQRRLTDLPGVTWAEVVQRLRVWRYEEGLSPKQIVPRVRQTWHVTKSVSAIRNWLRWADADFGPWAPDRPDSPMP